MIRGFFVSARGRFEARLRLEVHLNRPGLRPFHSVDFVIDTGTPFTLVAPKDQFEFGVDPFRDPYFATMEKVFNVSGGTCPACYASAELRDSSDSTGPGEELPIHFLTPRWQELSAATQGLFKTMPSLLGWDYLNRFTLILRQQDGRRGVYLLTEEEADRGLILPGRSLD